MDDKIAVEPSIEEESDESVFLMMSDDDDSVRLEGLEMFYKRYFKYLFNSCRRLCKGHIDVHEDASDLASDVLLKIYDKADSYRSQDISDQLIATYNTKAWINKISLHTYLDKKSVVDRDTDTIEKIISEQEDIGQKPIIQTQLIREAMECFSALSEKQQDIIRAYYMEKDAAKINARGKEGITEALAHEYKTTQQNIRKIVSRAKKSIEDCVKKRGLK